MHIVDIHAHILPHVDDGAADWEEAMEMASLSYAQGVRKIIATPHFIHHQDVERLKRKTLELQERATERFNGLHIYLGQEIQYFDGIVEYLDRGKALTMAGSRYVLVEFVPDVSISRILQAVRQLSQSGYIPIIAHMERYRILRNHTHLQALKDSPCCLQMNYGSLCGGFFDSNVKWCRSLIQNGDIDFLGSDMHGAKHRTPKIKEPVEWMKKKVEWDKLEKMFIQNPGKLQADKKE